MQRIVPVLTLFLLVFSYAPGAFAALPEPGDILPAFTLAPIPVEGDAAVLGLKSNAPFAIGDIPTPYVMIEVIGVYCTICREQAPSLTKLYKRLKKTKLDQRITLLGIAAGGTATEVKFIRESGDYLYPVAVDPNFEVYSALSEPKTPFTLIVDTQGKVLYTHRGIVSDVNALFKVIQELVQ
ncbi:MAG: TlpA family protein disulfide reductase [Proteobacteria bacterium]|nr:TlpA family protein disulfide reductase [Pseudomonadota bacterium]MBU1610215.1 TlpA family protein disulfide reductase [Pseudomonadota bacterium]